MYPEVERLLAEHVEDHHLVLDVGGAGEPSRRTNYIVDVMSWETWDAKYRRRPVADYRFSPETWCQMDICSGRLPFPDKMFDFTICSHTLEDLRDPLAVCKELVRVSRGGYIETPSPYFELTRGVDSGDKRYAGYYHHRWLVSRDERGLQFFAKPHFVHASRRFHFPPRYAERFRRQNLDRTRFLWSESFEARELIVLDRDDVESVVEGFIREVSGLNAAIMWHRAKLVGWRAAVATATRLGIRERLRNALYDAKE